jgi:hypothetical protein
MRIIYSHFMFVLFLMITVNSNAHHQNDYVVMLNGKWKFQLGDNMLWKNSDFNDDDWETIQVPSAWEDQGFSGYDGFAWYRKDFVLPKDYKNKDLYLSLGYIDDVDQVYLNGHLIGFSGELPPDFNTALDVERKYPIPAEYINHQGKNVISVRVYDQHLSGGIISGTIGILTGTEFQPDISLIGLWKFRAEDNLTWKEKDHNDSNWNTMVVPGNWKEHGYKDYNGTAWYRYKFTMPAGYEKQKMAFIVGLIGNCDEVYINGKLIGKTGTIPYIRKNKNLSFNNSGKDGDYVTDECSKSRIYNIPDNLLIKGQEVSISIRVFNTNFKGGIIEGPVGISRQSVLSKNIKDKLFK